MVIERLWPGSWKLAPKVWVVPNANFIAIKTFSWVLVNEQLLWGLTTPQLKAVIAHEQGHSFWQQVCRAFVQALAPALLPNLVRHQELQADDHAKRRGHGLALAEALLKLQEIFVRDLPQGGNYPPVDERVRRLTC